LKFPSVQPARSMPCTTVLLMPGSTVSPWATELVTPAKEVTPTTVYGLVQSLPHLPTTSKDLVTLPTILPSLDGVSVPLLAEVVK
jgi:hypothetical protein